MSFTGSDDSSNCSSSDSEVYDPIIAPAQGDKSKATANLVRMNGTIGTIEEDDVVSLGSIPLTKIIYKANSNSPEWKTEPGDAREPVENADTAKLAMIIRNKRSRDSRKQFEADSIIVQSPWLREALGEHVFQGYRGVSCDVERLVFQAPFHPFVHCWNDLLQLRERRDLPTRAKQHIALLHDYLEKEIGNTTKLYMDYHRNKIITFADLWMIFPPGATIISGSRGAISAFEVTEAKTVTTLKETFFAVSCEFVDWDGEYFGRRQHTIHIPEFLGMKPITDLHAFPLKYHEKKKKIKNKLIDRGKKFEQLAGYHFKFYDGFAVGIDERGREFETPVCGRFVIDTKSSQRYAFQLRVGVTGWNPKDLQVLGEHKQFTEESDDDGDYEININTRHRVELTPDYQMLCSNRIPGYELEGKQWLQFYVHHISDIDWSEEAIDKLMLPDAEKEFVTSLAASQLCDEPSGFDDVIKGKGKGVVVLLSGQPGVGKTLTAEAVAENMKVPLHTISLGDLGSGSGEIERNLRRVLNLVGQWKAILLLDECDVFLQARSPKNLDNNKIVSIFLRTLEYYRGILFMTTNYPDRLDEAVQSRIHISLEYPNLTKPLRCNIWSNLLGKAHALSHSDVDKLAGYDINGRQIKNIIKTATLLATGRQKKMNMEIIRMVLDMEKRRLPQVSSDSPISPPVSDEAASPSKKRKKHRGDEDSHSRKRVRDEC